MTTHSSGDIGVWRLSLRTPLWAAEFSFFNSMAKLLSLSGGALAHVDGNATK